MKALQIIAPMVLNYLLPSSFFGVDGKLYTFVIMAGLIFSIFMLSYMTFRMEKNKLYYSLFFAVGLTTLWLLSAFCKSITPFTVEIQKWLSFEYFARIMYPAAWFIFSETYTKRHQRINIGAAFLVSSGFLGFFIFFISKIDNFEVTASHTFVYTHLLFLGFIACYAVTIFSILRLRRFARKQKGVYTKQVNLITAGVFVTIIMDFIFAQNSFKLGFDPVPISHIIFLFFIWRAITKFRLLEVVPIAMREVFNNMDESVLVLNEDGTILDYNKSATLLFSHYFKPGVDISVLDLLNNIKLKITNPDEIRQIIEVGLKKADANFTIDTTLCSEPPKYLSIMFGPIYDKRKNPVGHLLVTDDITHKMGLIMENERQNHKLQEQNLELEAQTQELEAQKQELEAQKQELLAMNEDIESAMEKLKETQSQLIQSEKMASLGSLVAGIAHEINTPLGSINSNLDINRIIATKLKSTQGISEEGLILISKLERTNEINTMACKRILEIVMSLKNFSRLDEADFQKADIHEGINSTLLLLNNQLKNRITVHKDFGQLPLIDCYPNQLNQVFMNLLVNASQAIAETGDIYIKTEPYMDRIRIYITDTGSGIKPENMDKLFNPGFTTKGVGVGTGLGLSITYKIIESHNGTIKVENTVDKGARFIISLPITNSR